MEYLTVLVSALGAVIYGMLVYVKNKVSANESFDGVKLIQTALVGVIVGVVMVAFKLPIVDASNAVDVMMVATGATVMVEAVAKAIYRKIKAFVSE